jgi:hypothetical protein
VIKTDCLAAKQTQSLAAAQNGASLEDPLGILLVQSQQLTGALAELCEHTGDTKNLTLVAQTILSAQLKLGVETLLLEGATGTTVSCSVVSVVLAHAADWFGYNDKDTIMQQLSALLKQILSSMSPLPRQPHSRTRGQLSLRRLRRCRCRLAAAATAGGSVPLPLCGGKACVRREDMMSSRAAGKGGSISEASGTEVRFGCGGAVGSSQDGRLWPVASCGVVGVGMGEC